MLPSLCYNFPALHVELASAPEGVSFVASCLSPSKTGQPLCPACLALLDNLPLPPKEALLSVQEMQDRGADLWDTDQLKAASVIGQRQADKDQALQQEIHAIDSFVSGHSTLAPLPNNDKQKQMLISRQIILYLAYSLEKNVIESREAITLLTAAENTLYASLNGQDKDNADFLADLPGEGSITSLFTSTPATPPVNPLAIVDALLALLPQEACLFTSDPEMRARILENTRDQKNDAPLPQKINNPALPGTTQITLPGWKLAGLQEPTPGLPWLARTVTVYAQMP